MSLHGIFEGVDTFDAIMNRIEKAFGVNPLRGDKGVQARQKADAEAVRNLVSPLIESEIGRRTYPQLFCALNHPNRFFRERIQRIIFADAKLHLFAEVGETPKKPEEVQSDSLRDGIL